jgi:hypothetical protein
MQEKKRFFFILKVWGIVWRNRTKKPRNHAGGKETAPPRLKRRNQCDIIT